MAALACATPLAAPSALAAASDFSDVHVRLIRSSANETSARQLFVNGRAPAKCMPAIASATVVGTDVSLVLSEPEVGCDSRRMSRFTERLPAAIAMNTPIVGGQTYRVRSYVEQGGVRSLVAFQLLDTRAAPRAVDPESGTWWSIDNRDDGPAAAGNAASIEVQGDTISLAMLGFAQTGAANWQFGSGLLRGDVATINLAQPGNGDTLFAPHGNTVAASQGPRVELEFLSPTRARAFIVHSHDGRDSEVESLTFSRSRFENGPVGDTWNGQWVFLGDDNTTTPVLLEFTEAASADAESFHLTDAAHAYSLDCRLDTTAHMPQACILSSGGEQLADFDAVGIDRMTGQTQGDMPAKLIRVPR